MNYFQLFGLTPSFSIDMAQLSAHYRTLQKKFHPDNFVTASERDKALSMQKTSQINDAYLTLKQPVTRAEYLLELLAGIGIDQNKTIDDPMFLIAQMELRERLEEIEHSANLTKLSQLEKELIGMNQQLISCIDEGFLQEDWRCVVSNVNKLKFIVKLKKDIDLVEDRLMD